MQQSHWTTVSPFGGRLGNDSPSLRHRLGTRTISSLPAQYIHKYFKCTCPYAYTYTYRYANVYTSAYARTRAHPHVCIYKCTRICTCICIHVCLWMYICTYIYRCRCINSCTSMYLWILPILNRAHRTLNRVISPPFFLCPPQLTSSPTLQTSALGNPHGAHRIKKSQEGKRYHCEQRQSTEGSQTMHQGGRKADNWWQSQLVGGRGSPCSTRSLPT